MTYVGASQHMLGSTSYVGAPIYIYMFMGVRGIMFKPHRICFDTTKYVGALLNMLGHHDICWSLAMYLHV